MSIDKWKEIIAKLEKDTGRLISELTWDDLEPYLK